MPPIFSSGRFWVGFAVGTVLSGGTVSAIHYFLNRLPSGWGNQRGFSVTPQNPGQLGGQ
jgi:hypothetical protein